MASSNASLTLEAFKSATDITQIEQALIAALEQIQAGTLLDITPANSLFAVMSQQTWWHLFAAVIACVGAS